MVNSIQDVLVLAGSILGVIAALGTVFTYLRGSVYKGAIEALEKMTATQKEEIELNEKKLTRLENENKRYKETVNSLQGQVKVLTLQRPSAEVLAELMVKLEEHHQETVKLLTSGNRP